MKPDNHVDHKKNAEIKKLLNQLDNQLDKVQNDIDVIQIKKTLNKLDDIHPIPEENKIPKAEFLDHLNNELFDIAFAEIEVSEKEPEEKKALQKDKKPVYSRKYVRYCAAAACFIAVFAATAIGDKVKYEHKIEFDDTKVYITGRLAASKDESKETIKEPGFTTFKEIKDASGYDFLEPGNIDSITEIDIETTDIYENIHAELVYKGKPINMRIKNYVTLDIANEAIVEKEEYSTFEIQTKDGATLFIVRNDNWYAIKGFDDYTSYYFSTFETYELALEFINDLKR